MAKLNDLDDVTISNPRVGDVVKYTATGWANASEMHSPAGGNACGTSDNYTEDNKAETITEPWTWEVSNNQCGVIVKGDENDEFGELCPSRVEVGNKNGRAQLKVFDGGNSRLTAFNDQLEFYDVNVPNGITLGELAGCCSGGGGSGGGVSGSGGAGTNAVQVVNFPGAGVFQYDCGNKTKQAWNPDDGALPSDWYDTDLYDIFEEDVNDQTVVFPPGTNACILLFTYGITIGPTPEYETGGEDPKEGYASVSYNMRLESNRTLELSPGKLAAGTKVQTRILPWEQASLIDGGNPDSIRRRAPQQSNSNTQMIRVNLNAESTADNPCRLKMRPFCSVNRVKRGRLTVASGRVICIPFYDDGTNFRPTTFNIGEEFEDYIEDDGGLDIAFEERQQSAELKGLMNYYTNAIRETLDFDDNLDPDGIPVLQQALRDIFGLKQETVGDLNYYYNRLNTIRDLVIPYVGFQFGFETTNTVRSF